MKITLLRLTIELSRQLRDEDDSFASLILASVLALQLASPLFLVLLNSITEAQFVRVQVGEFWAYATLAVLLSCTLAVFIQWEERRNGFVEVRDIDRFQKPIGRVLVWIVYCICVFLQLILYFEVKLLGILTSALVLVLPVFPADRVLKE
ncbi:MAG: hypothetical protein ABIH12_00540 [Pseudomonadota bacterium]